MGNLSPLLCALLARTPLNFTCVLLLLLLEKLLILSERVSSLLFWRYEYATALYHCAAAAD
jgi:hypothetical protein